MAGTATGDGIRAPGLIAGVAFLTPTLSRFLFQLLNGLLRGAEKVRVYMDQDSGMRAAFLAAIVDRIRDRTGDGWFVSVLKESTIHQKENAVQKTELRLAKAATWFPAMPEGRLMVELMKEEMTRAKTLEQFDDQSLERGRVKRVIGTLTMT